MNLLTFQKVKARVQVKIYLKKEANKTVEIRFFLRIIVTISLFQVHRAGRVQLVTMATLQLVRSQTVMNVNVQVV